MKKENNLRVDINNYHDSTENEDVAILDNKALEMLKNEELKESYQLREERRGDLFLAGWRPLIGWIGAFGIGFNSVIIPILQGFGLDIKPIDTESIIAMVAGVLGVATMRTYEKNKNIDTKEIK